MAMTLKQLEKEAATSPAEREPKEPRVAEPEPKRAMFVICGTRFRYAELSNTREVLSAAGVEITTAGLELGFVRGLELIEAETVIRLEDIFVEDYDAIIFVGSPASRRQLNDAVLMDIVAEAVEADKIVGAIGGSVQVLAAAGVLQGVRVTGTPAEWRSFQRAGAEYTDVAVERDGLIITARDSTAASQFARTITDVLFGREESVEPVERPAERTPIRSRY